jgi:hypothetical protein
MFPPGDIFWLAALAGLILVWIWLHYRTASLPIRERQWPCHGFDTHRIVPRIQRLRSDYVSELHSREHETPYREEMLASARRAIELLPFFKHRQAGGELLPASAHDEGARN